MYALQVSAPARLLCSAVLVAPNLLLTARHCVSVNGAQTVDCGRTPLGDLVEPEFVTLSNVLSFIDAPPTAAPAPAVRRLEVPTEGDDVCGFDLAAVVLEDNVSGTAPLPLRSKVPAALGEQYTAVGYGRATANAGGRGGVRLKLSDREVSCLGEACKTPATTAEFGGSDGICLGDSGGPAVDTTGRVFGIASRSVEGCEAPIYSSLSAFDDWLGPLLIEAADLGGYELEPTPPREPRDEPLTEPPVDPPPSAPRQGLGEACSATRSCEASLVCFYETGPDEATCTQSCKHSADCSDDEVCDEDFSVCRVPTAPSTGNEGCAFARRGAPSAAWPALLLLVVGLGCRLRRRGAGSPGAA